MRWSFEVDEDVVEFYDEGASEWPDSARLLCIMTPLDMIEFQQKLKEAMFEWSRINGKKLDEGKPK